MTLPILLPRLNRPLPLTEHYPFPFYPSSLWPFFIFPIMSHPLLPQLPRYHVTVHLTEIANPDIAEVKRLASILLLSSTHSSPSPPYPIETYT